MEQQLDQVLKLGRLCLSWCVSVCLLRAGRTVGRGEEGRVTFAVAVNEPVLQHLHVFDAAHNDTSAV